VCGADIAASAGSVLVTVADLLH